MMYPEGAIVRISATFNFDVDEDTYFSVTRFGYPREQTRYGTPGDGMTIIRNEEDHKKCYVDFDTFDKPGIYKYFIYSRGANKAGAKGIFAVE
jgi:hypothetical protein